MPQARNETLPPTVDPRAAERADRVRRAASPWLHEEVGRRMAGRLQWMLHAPSAWWDWQPSNGGYEAHRAVVERWPDAECWWTDHDWAQELSQDRLRPSVWRRLTGPAVRQGVPPPGGVQMVWANMSLHRSASPLSWLDNWAQALAAGGMLMFSCLGPDSLKELRAVYEEQGWAPASQVFTDMHDWGDLAVRAGFAEPVMDMERIRLSWSSADALELELRSLGRNLHPARSRHTRSSGWRTYWRRLMDERLRGPDGRLHLSFEIVYGHALKAPPRVTMQRQTDIGLDQMRTMLSRKPNRA